MHVIAQRRRQKRSRDAGKRKKKVVNAIQDERIYSRRKAYSREICFYIELVLHLYLELQYFNLPPVFRSGCRLWLYLVHIKISRINTLIHHLIIKMLSAEDNTGRLLFMVLMIFIVMLP